MSLQFPFPRNTRDFFLMFREYKPEEGLDDLLDRIDFSGVSPRHIYFSVLGRVPESAKATVGGPRYDPRQHMKLAILSKEFRGKLIRLFLAAFPERQREIFVHIPKAAGTDLTRRLSNRFGSVNELMQHETLVPPEELFNHLRRVVIEDQETAPILVTGHIPLLWYLNNELIRPTDQIFTIIRDPASRVLSSINYVLTQFLEDRELRSADTREWASFLQIPQAINPDINAEELIALGRRILYQLKIVPKNAMCVHLGGGDAESALDAMVRSNIEVTDMTHYEDWLRWRWAITFEGKRENESLKVMTWDKFGTEDLQYIEQINDQDQIIYDRIIAALVMKPDRFSVFGEDIMKVCAA